MARRATLIFLLIFQSFWLAVVLPGHTRGVVTLPGYKAATCESASMPAMPDCCSSERALPSDRGLPSDRKSAPDPDRAAHCAICFFAARLTMSPVVDLAPAPLRLVRVLPPVDSEYWISLNCLPTYLGRAPPIA
jgi:hypothetical protein